VSQFYQLGLGRNLLHTYMLFTLTAPPEAQGLGAGIMLCNFRGLYQCYITLHKVGER